MGIYGNYAKNIILEQMPLQEIYNNNQIFFKEFIYNEKAFISILEANEDDKKQKDEKFNQFREKLYFILGKLGDKVINLAKFIKNKIVVGVKSLILKITQKAADLASNKKIKEMQKENYNSDDKLKNTKFKVLKYNWALYDRINYSSDVNLDDYIKLLRKKIRFGSGYDEEEAKDEDVFGKITSIMQLDKIAKTIGDVISDDSIKNYTVKTKYTINGKEVEGVDQYKTFKNITDNIGKILEEQEGYSFQTYEDLIGTIMESKDIIHNMNKFVSFSLSYSNQLISFNRELEKLRNGIKTYVEDDDPYSKRVLDDISHVSSDILRAYLAVNSFVSVISKMFTYYTRDYIKAVTLLLSKAENKTTEKSADDFDDDFDEDKE